VTGEAQLGITAIEKRDHMRLASSQDTELDGPAIEVRALRKVYRGGVEAVKGIDFEVAPG
jgi:hypothetical protein